MIFIIKRYLLAYGIFYIRVFTSGLILMIIGITFVHIGIYYLEDIVLLPIEKFLNPLPPPHSSYELKTINIVSVNLKETYDLVDTIDFKSPGYLVITIASSEFVLAEVTVVNRKTYESVSTIVTNNPLLGSQYSKMIPILKPGEYEIYAKNLSPVAKTVSLRLDIYYLVEYLDATFAKWLQGLGGLMFLIGLFVIIFSPIIAAKQAEAVYLTPKKIREDLARMGILRRHRTEEE